MVEAEDPCKKEKNKKLLRLEAKYCLLTNGCPDILIRYKDRALNYWNRSSFLKLVNSLSSGRVSCYF